MCRFIQLRGIAKQHLWQPGTNLRAWLFTIMHNQHVNNVRHSAREGITVDLADAPTLTAEPVAGGIQSLAAALYRGVHWRRK